MAEVLLQRDLDKRGIEAHVHSAGLVTHGRPAAEEVIELMNARGIDAGSHLSRRLSVDLLGSVDLVLGMAREHVREVVLLQPALFSRTFTLKEIVRRGREHGPRRHDEEVLEWLERLSADRRPADFLGASDQDDIFDPIGRRMGVFKKAATEIEELGTELVDLMWPATSAFGSRAPVQ